MRRKQGTLTPTLSHRMGEGEDEGALHAGQFIRVGIIPLQSQSGCWILTPGPKKFLRRKLAVVFRKT